MGRAPSRGVSLAKRRHVLEYKDYYKILEVPRNADEKAIRKAFRRLARQYHPDVNPNDPSAEERFKEITEAYEVLGDSDKRSKYDRFGQEWNRHQQAGAGGFDWGPWSQGQPGPSQQYTYATAEDLEDLFGGTGFSDFFDTLFGGGRRRQRPGGFAGGARPQRAIRGRDVEHPVRISLAEAYSGTERVLSKDGRRLEVQIPPGVRTGSKVRLKGEGAPSGGSAPGGDLYLVVEVEDDPLFDRRGHDLFIDVEVPLTTAVLGGEVTVPSMTGEVTLTIPEETQNARRFRLRGKGMPEMKISDSYGDLYVTAHVRVPTNLSDEERALFEDLRRLRGDE